MYAVQHPAGLPERCWVHAGPGRYPGSGAARRLGSGAGAVQSAGGCRASVPCAAGGSQLRHGRQVSCISLQLEPAREPGPAARPAAQWCCQAAVSLAPHAPSSTRQFQFRTVRYTLTDPLPASQHTCPQEDSHTRCFQALASKQQVHVVTDDRAPQPSWPMSSFTQSL